MRTLQQPCPFIPARRTPEHLNVTTFLAGSVICFPVWGSRVGLSKDKIASTSLVQLLQFRDKRYQVRLPVYVMHVNVANTALLVYDEKSPLGYSV